ncbi:MAG: energy transducer TonB [Pyrinomonadaceae bacterium]|nr:energy transducer TonB [Sphingobacteriaceae bacterium]
MENEPVNMEEDGVESGPLVYKDRSLLYMGGILGVIILIMGYLALFVDDPSHLFKSKKEYLSADADKSLLLDKSGSMSNDEVRTSLTKFIEAFYYDQRRGYFDPPSYFADITETFYNYHNLTHQRLKEIYWRRQNERNNFKRNWIVSTLQFERVESRITATYWSKESYFKPIANEDYSALIKYELIINEMGKIVSLREAEVKNVEKRRRELDSMVINQLPSSTPPLSNSTGVADKVYDHSLVESQPEFPGGQKELTKYIGTNLNYPALAKQNNIHGKVYLSFIIEKEGNLTDIKVKQGIGSGCDEEALRILRGAPKWKPGMVSGAPVRTYYVLGITFQL